MVRQLKSDCDYAISEKLSCQYESRDDTCSCLSSSRCCCERTRCENHHHQSGLDDSSPYELPLACCPSCGLSGVFSCSVAALCLRVFLRVLFGVTVASLITSPSTPQSTPVLQDLSLSQAFHQTEAMNDMSLPPPPPPPPPPEEQEMKSILQKKGFGLSRMRTILLQQCVPAPHPLLANP